MDPVAALQVSLSIIAGLKSLLDGLAAKGSLSADELAALKAHSAALHALLQQTP